MKKKLISLLVVDLSTSSNTAGARMVPLTKYFLLGKYNVAYLVNQEAWRKYQSLLEKSEATKIKANIFPFSDRFSNKKFLIFFEVLKRIFLTPFAKINKKPDFVYSLTGIICDVFVSFIIKKKTGCFWIANVDNIEASPSQKPGPYLINLISFLSFKVSLFFLRYADFVFITSPLAVLKETLEQGGISPQKIIFSENGIDLKFIESVSSEIGRGYDGSFMGRIHEGKGVFDLVKVWGNVLAKCPHIGKLVVIGEGEPGITNRLKSMINSRSLKNRILLSGFVGEEKKCRLLKSAKIFLFPSYYDANPGVIKEALACGLPVVAYDLPIFTEHYPKGLIQTVPLGDVEKFTEQVLALIENGRIRKRLGRRGKQFVQKFNWQVIFKEQERLMLNLVKKNE